MRLLIRTSPAGHSLHYRILPCHRRFIRRHLPMQEVMNELHLGHHRRRQHEGVEVRLPMLRWMELMATLSGIQALTNCAALRAL